LQLKILPPWWKTWWFRVLAGLVLAGSIAGFVKRRIDLANKENSYKLRLAQSELKAIRSQMNPHFIFNCITAIDGLIARNERAKASEYLGKFSRLMRQVLQLSSNQFVSLGEDLDTLQLYLQLEQLRMEGGFTFTINADAELRQNLELPPLMLQPFAENAILHGLKPKADSNRQLHITISRQGQSIVCTIADNGIGRQAAAALQPAQPGHQSSGMRLTQERLQLLQDVLGYKTQFTVVDAPTDTGTVVTITLTKTSTTSD
jgi:LytS/YehU family sensor histidine kinase